MRIARKRFKPQVQVIKHRFNEFITAPEVRVIGANDEHVGTMSIGAALAMAREQELDLVEINPNSLPPVVKLTEYGQYKYQKEKEERLMKKKQKEVEVKGVRLSLRIGDHDAQIRADQAARFFAAGNKVKLEIILRGRERAFTQNAIQVLHDFIEQLKKTTPIKVEQPISKQANKITVLLAKT